MNETARQCLFPWSPLVSTPGPARKYTRAPEGAQMSNQCGSTLQTLPAAMERSIALVLAPIPTIGARSESAPASANPPTKPLSRDGLKRTGPTPAGLESEPQIDHRGLQAPNAPIPSGSSWRRNYKSLFSRMNGWSWELILLGVGMMTAFCAFAAGLMLARFLRW
jgi:hypothetical protein